MIVDAHVHIWKKDPRFPDPSVTIMSPASDIPLELLRRYMDEHGVGRAVLVQPMYPGEDNSLVADAARADPDRFAAVCVVDPRLPEAPDRLEHWVKERGCRGLRLRPAFAGEGVAFENDPLWERCRKLGIVVSILARREHVEAIDRRAGRFPDVRLIVDHLAHPDPVAGPAAPAFQALLALADRPNVFVKPTGFHNFSKRPYPHEDCDAIFKAVLDRFGPDRMIWGSDFPHVLLKAGYGPALRHFERRYPYLGKDDRDRILGRTAERLYWA
jgi:predicted TIM-barrel fold metal-dependent hydrolase